MSDNNEEKVDYLDVDDVVPGQNYVCLSFVSPEALIKKREAFNVSKFLQSYCKEQNLEFKDVYSKYEDFAYKFSDKLQRDFDEQNNFQTSMRGVKVRGVYDTRQAAESRAKKLSTSDSSFHVFVGQVGYWLPWDPNADGIQDEVFQNSQLNDMMEKYQENNVNRDIFYDEQKREKVKAAREEALAKKREEQEQKALEAATDSESVLEELKEGIEEIVEGAEKVEAGVEEIVDGVEKIEEAVKDASGGVTKEVHKLDEDMTNSLESIDPWLANKLNSSSDPTPKHVPEEASDPPCTDVDNKVDKETGELNPNINFEPEPEPVTEDC
uniref:Uncharacterized protein n=1 Tax=viral metagenome TaxID=1070528 RepID=A0A6C0CDW4_9ZZZZ